MMNQKTVYEIADSDESSMADARVSDARATAAGIPLRPGDDKGDIEGGAAHAPPHAASAGCMRSPFCIAAIVLLALMIAGSATAGILVSKRSGSDGGEAGSAGVAGGAGANGTESASLPTVPEGDARVFTVAVKAATPHDPDAFLQGFEYNAARGVFFESTGLRDGRSSLRRVEIETGKVLQQVKLPDETLFGEGMTLHGDEYIYMLTWKAEKGFIFNQTSLEVIEEWKYSGEGWGLASDRANDEVYMSDGTNELRVLDAGTLGEKRRVSVLLNGEPLKELNEIEWICGEVWANIWGQNTIARIDPTTGAVRSVINVKGLPRKEDVKKVHNVLNGIAYDDSTGRIWITGKLWPKVYEVTVNDDTLAKQCGLK